MFSSEFPSDPSQFIDFAQFSETEDVGSEESKSETNQITNSPHPGFSDIYDPFGHTNFELSLSSDMDSYRNLWRDANEELKTSDDNVRYPSIRDAQNETSSSLNLNSDDIITYMHLVHGPQQSAVPTHFHQLTLPSGDTSGQHGNAEQCNINNKHFSDNLNILNYRKMPIKDWKQIRKIILVITRDKHEPRLQCKDCGKFLANRNALRKHKWLCGTKSFRKSYECLYPGCAVIATSCNEYVTHMKTHGQPFIYECRAPGCGRLFGHKSTLRAGKSYECLYPGCAVIPKSRKEYLTHRKAHGQPFIFQCKVTGCERIFNNESSFQKHKQTHEPHPQCEDCGKFFTTRNGLQKHKKICQTKSR
ncbi:Uncharacterized protein BM_BM17458 [Brugia malayi]|uniref:C2H2-type domain-containing protein n=1 Tax=Brugia malayi TaxID=6279 RepID=A0A4E9FA20_BRUMA|nr:Uncharacterized protein BM_BM17458 [Brugia malayi]VIO92975.1 Uncharacterized protein BM_BM17458 [Brugia malayi]